MKKKHMKALNPQRREGLLALREIERKRTDFGASTHKWVTLPNGSQQIVNITKRVLLKKPYKSDYLNKEVIREMNSYYESQLNKQKALEEVELRKQQEALIEKAPETFSIIHPEEKQGVVID